MPPSASAYRTQVMRRDPDHGTLSHMPIDGSDHPAVEPAVHRAAIRRRWTTVGVLALVGAGIVVVFGSAYASCSGLAKLQAWTVIIGALSLGIAAFCVAGASRAVATLGIRHLPEYPPFWVAGLIGGLLVLVYAALGPHPFPASECALDRALLRDFLSRALPVPLALAVAVWA